MFMVVDWEKKLLQIGFRPLRGSPARGLVATSTLLARSRGHEPRCSWWSHPARVSPLPDVRLPLPSFVRQAQLLRLIRIVNFVLRPLVRNRYARPLLKTAIALWALGIPWATPERTDSPRNAPRLEEAKDHFRKLLADSATVRRTARERRLGIVGKPMRLGHFSLLPLGSSEEEETYAVWLPAPRALALDTQGRTRPLTPTAACGDWRLFSVTAQDTALLAGTTGTFALGPASLVQSLRARLGCGKEKE